MSQTVKTTTPAETLNQRSSRSTDSAETEQAQSHLLYDVNMLGVFKQLNSKFDEIIARLATLENTVAASMTNSSSSDRQCEKSFKNELYVQAELFTKSNSLPTKCVEDLKKFEENLNDSIFLKAAVSFH